MISDDYLERVYAGVLGKLVGVYLGRPIENWTHERIVDTFGQIDRYVHEERGRRLIVTDDDITGTFTFLRALEDYGFDRKLTPAQIGQTWLNYIIEGKTILWWGGMGNSTEHTAYLRLKSGLRAPASGAIATNGKVTAEQIGGQIFIDGWGLVCPGDPARAADFAQRAASVSHDGEGIYGAQVIAALVASAFVESDLDRMLDTALKQIPADCTIYRLIGDLRRWHATGEDWQASRARLQAKYGYDKYPGVCHIVPNHGLVILALLHGAGDFDRSMTIVNTCGWDTDCNAGNVGCILGVRNGLPGISERWREPVADRLYLPSADGGRSITDAAREAIAVADAGRRLAGQDPLPPRPRFDFNLPGSVQGWIGGENVDGALRVADRASTPTFIPPHTKDLVSGYVLVANPTLFTGHVVRAKLRSGTGRLFLSHYGPQDESLSLEGPRFENGEAIWTIPDTGGFPIHEIGVQGDLVLESLDWSGVPKTTWPAVEGTMAGRAWADALSRFNYVRDKLNFLVQNEGVGLLVQGSREWTNYRIEVSLTPRMAIGSGVAVRYQGLRRYYAFVFGEAGEVRFDKVLDGTRILSKASFSWEPYRTYRVAVEAEGGRLRAWIDRQLVLQAEDEDLDRGGFGFVVEEGCLGVESPGVSPL